VEVDLQTPPPNQGDTISLERLRLLNEAEAAPAGKVADVVKAAGISEATYRRLRARKEKGQLDAMRPRKRGPKPRAVVAEVLQADPVLERFDTRLAEIETILGGLLRAHRPEGGFGEDPLALDLAWFLVERLGYRRAAELLGIPRPTLERRLKS